MNQHIFKRLYINFNSTMVRLKGGSLDCMTAASIFQFHYGTIKRVAVVSSAE